MCLEGCAWLPLVSPLKLLQLMLPCRPTDVNQVTFLVTLCAWKLQTTVTCAVRSASPMCSSTCVSAVHVVSHLTIQHRCLHPETGQTSRNETTRPCRHGTRCSTPQVSSHCQVAVRLCYTFPDSHHPHHETLSQPPPCGQHWRPPCV